MLARDGVLEVASGLVLRLPLPLALGVHGSEMADVELGKQMASSPSGAVRRVYRLSPPGATRH